MRIKNIISVILLLTLLITGCNNTGNDSETEDNIVPVNIQKVLKVNI